MLSAFVARYFIHKSMAVYYCHVFNEFEQIQVHGDRWKVLISCTLNEKWPVFLFTGRYYNIELSATRLTN